MSYIHYVTFRWQTIGPNAQFGYIMKTGKSDNIMPNETAMQEVMAKIRAELQETGFAFRESVTLILFNHTVVFEE